ncbi:MAG: LPS-assembly protein LptD [Armatimonadota bacterium]
MRHLIIRALILCCIAALLTPLAAQEAVAPPPAAETAPAPAPAAEAPAQPDDEPLPPPAPGFRRIHVLAERTQVLQQSTVRFLGNVTFETDDLTITADEVEYKAQTQLATAQGHVSVRTADGTTYQGDNLALDVPARQWRFRDISVEYLPGTLGKEFIGSTFLRSEEFLGTERELHGTNTRVTTCDQPEPHYYLSAGSIDIYPNDKLIAHNVNFYIMGRRVLHLPWFYMWLRQKKTPFVPTAGHNETEGYFARVLYQYLFDDQNLGGIRVDQTEKLGTGVGVNHFYSLPGGYGEAFVYGRQGLEEYVARLDHLQQLPADIQLKLTGDVRKNSLFTSQPTTLTNINAQAQRRIGPSLTQLTYIRNLNQGLFRSDNTNANFRYDYTTQATTFRYSGEYSSYGRFGTAGDLPANEEMWNHLLWTHRLGFGKLNLRLDERTDVDGDDYTGDDNFFGLQRMPEVYLETDQNQLQWEMLKRVPSQFTVGWGLFDEQPNDVRLSRYLFNWRPQPKPIKWGRTVLTPTGSLRQTVYGDPDMTAMYVISDGMEARTTVGPFSNILGYRKNQYHGYSPFRFDAAYPSETITEGMQYITPNLRLYLNSGKDLENDRWQDLLFRSEALMTPAFRMNHSVAYNLNNGQWRDMVSQFKYDRSEVVSLGVDTRYDMEGARMRRVSTNLAWNINPQWRVQWLGGYDAPNKKLLYNEILVTRDLHCWDVSAYYSYQQKYFYLYFRLKALDIPLPQFGIGRGGQILGAGQGWPL